MKVQENHLSSQFQVSKKAEQQERHQVPQVRSFVNTRLDLGNYKDRVLINKSEGIIKEFSIKENNPDNPVVSKKVLDSLDMGMINFNQKERDTLAQILSDKAQKAKAKLN